MAEIIERVRRIPRGTVQTYGGIDPHAPRLVGRVLATTHRELPWHRVVRADGSLTQGKRQRELLLREGVPMRGGRVDLRRARVRRAVTPAPRTGRLKGAYSGQFVTRSVNVASES